MSTATFNDASNVTIIAPPKKLDRVPLRDILFVALMYAMNNKDTAIILTKRYSERRGWNHLINWDS